VGSLNYESADNDSSSDDDDDDVGSMNREVADSDEELEVFGAAPSTVSKLSTFTNPRDVPRANVPVIEIERNSSLAAEAAVNIKPEMALSLTNPTPISTNECSIDEINIDKMAAAAAEKEGEEDDDEFEWTDDNINEAKTVISKLLENEREKKVTNERVDFSEDIRQFNAAIAQTQLDADLVHDAVESNFESEDFVNKLKNEARQALQDITGVYGEGLGDQSILVDESEDSLDKKAANSDYQQSTRGILGAIAEGDEEDDDDEQIPTNKTRKEIDDRYQIHEIKSVTLSAEPMKSSDAIQLDNFGEDYEKASCDQPTHMDANHAFENIKYDQVLLFFQNLDFSGFESRITVHSESKSWMSSFVGVKLKYDRCQEDLKTPFLIAEVDYDPFNIFHLDILRTIYCFFLSSKGDIKSIDNRWERIGFQGSDPRTDINRSMKCLSLLQIVHFTEKQPALAKALFAMSNCSSTNLSTRAEMEKSWPFLCVSIMFTKESLSALRQGVLNSYCNKLHSSLEAIHIFYEACFIEFGKLLLKYPESHHAVHLATIRKRCESDVSKILKHISDRTAAKRIVEQQVQEIQFSNLDESIANDIDDRSNDLSANLGSRAKRFVSDK
jgi:hypothetical protein